MSPFNKFSKLLLFKKNNTPKPQNYSAISFAYFLAKIMTHPPQKKCLLRQRMNEKNETGQLRKEWSGLEYTQVPLCTTQLHCSQASLQGSTLPKSLHIPYPGPWLCPLSAQGPVSRDQEGKMVRRNLRSPYSSTLVLLISSCPPQPLWLHPCLSLPLGLKGSRIGTQDGKIRFKKTRSCCNYLGHLPETQLAHLCPHLSRSRPLGVISMYYLAG